MVLSELNFSSSIDDEDDTTVALLVPVIQAQHVSSALAIADLVHRHSTHWGVSNIPTSFLQPLNAALSVIINDLESPDHKSAFIKLAVALHCLSRRSVAAESMLRMLRLMLRQKGLMSSEDIENMFKDANDHWEATVFGLASSLGGGEDVQMEIADAESSQPTRARGVDVDEAYDMLIEKWDHLNMGGVSSSSSSSS